MGSSQLSSAFNVSGFCQVDGRGSFGASLMEETDSGKSFFACSDPSFNKVLQEMYKLLFSQLEEGIVAGLIVKKNVNVRNSQRSVKIHLGPLKIQIFTTKKPGIGFMIIDLPFDRQNKNVDPGSAFSDEEE